jgi:hypothetical protein
MPMDLFSVSTCCHIFFGTSALLRTCAPGSAFRPDTPALALHVDCQDPCIVSHLLLPHASLMSPYFAGQACEKYGDVAYPIAKNGVSRRYILTGFRLSVRQSNKQSQLSDLRCLTSKATARLQLNVPSSCPANLSDLSSGNGMLQPCQLLSIPNSFLGLPPPSGS